MANALNSPAEPPGVRQTSSRHRLLLSGRSIQVEGCPAVADDLEVLSCAGHAAAPGVPPRVSIIMLTFNRPQFIGRAIQSAVDQHFRDWELIIVQDGNNEHIVRVVNQWLKREPRIRYFHRPQPGNIANACNYGIARARGEYIAILDDDDYWVCADKLSKQIHFLDENPEYAGCGGGVIVIDEHGVEQLRYLKPEDDADIRRHALFANPLAHSTSMFRKCAGEMVGLYEESLAGFQDWDLWLKLGQVGKLYNFPEPFLYYTLWSGGGSFTAQRANTRCSLKIVQRHWGKYRGSWAAWLFAFMYFCYARIPVRLRTSTFPALSRMKKALFSPKAQEPPPAESEKKKAVGAG
jgi:glycosyltransferase involved in cell wall biosynthesis